jgi:hypothetical protein
MFQFFREVDSTIWNLQFFHGNYLECNFYTNSLEFGRQLLHQNFGFLKLELILIGEYIESNGTQLLHQKFGTFEIIAGIAYPMVPRLEQASGTF